MRTFKRCSLEAAVLFLLPALLPGTALANPEYFWGAQEFYTQKEHVRYLLLFPPQYDPHRRYELWLNLHGSPGCASHAIYQYREPARQRDVFLLAPQASGWSGASYARPDGKTDLYRAWDMRRDRARILAVLDEVQGRYPISGKRVALLGFSAGCEMGWRLLADRSQTFYFFGGVANGFQRGRSPVRDADLRRAAKHVAHFYAAGQADGFAGPMFQRTARKLQADGFELRTAFPAGVGHDRPPVIQAPLLAFMDAVRARQKGTEESRGTALPEHVALFRRRFILLGVFGGTLLSTACLLFLFQRRRAQRG